MTDKNHAAEYLTEAREALLRARTAEEVELARYALAEALALQVLEGVAG